METLANCCVVTGIKIKINKNPCCCCKMINFGVGTYHTMYTDEPLAGVIIGRFIAYYTAQRIAIPQAGKANIPAFFNIERAKLYREF